MILILSFNHPHITAKCVQSVLNIANDQKIALVHNGSTDNHVAQLSKEFPEIEHWIINENKGFSAGANFALKKAFTESSWVFFLTNDTELTKFTLNTKNLEPGFYAPQVWLRKIGRVDYGIGFFDSSKGQIQHLKNQDEKSDLKSGQYFYIPGTAFLITKDIFERIGLFDESLHTYWEDVDYGVRASKLGIQFKLLNQIELIHQGRKTTKGNPFYSNYLFRKNQKTISRKHCPKLLLPVLYFYLLKQNLKFKFPFNLISSSPKDPGISKRNSG